MITRKCRDCEIAGYLEEEAGYAWYGHDETGSIRALAREWHRHCRGCDCGCRNRESLLSLVRSFLRDKHDDLLMWQLLWPVAREEMRMNSQETEGRIHPHVPHPVHLRIRKHRQGMGKIALANDWAATHLAVVFGVAWTIWLFFIIPLVAPYLGATAEGKIFFYSSGWIQLFALPLMVYVGNKLQRSSDAQSDVIHEALTHIATAGDQNAKLLEQNTSLTRDVHELSIQIHRKVSGDNIGMPLPSTAKSDYP